MDIKLIFIDLDGTLLKNDRSICQKSLNALHKAQSEFGIKVIITTARQYPRFKEFYQSMEFSSPIICCGGAEIYKSANGEISKRYRIDAKVSQEIAQFADENDILLTITNEDATYCKKVGPFLKNLPVGSKYISDYTDAASEAPIRMIAMKDDKMNLFHEFCNEQHHDSCNIELSNAPDGSLWSVIILPKEANKGNAIRYVCDNLSIPMDQVMAIGDTLVDKSMLEVVGYPVLMGNAPEEMKNMGYHITSTNEDAGVAKALKEILWNTTTS